MHDGVIARDPCSRRTSPGTGSQRAYVATTEQIRQLHDAVPAGVAPQILLGAFVGLRLAEAAALRPEDADFIRAIVSRSSSGSRSLSSRTPAAHQSRIPHDLALMLSAAVQGPQLVTNELGRPAGPWIIERAVRAARAEIAGLPPNSRFHDLRPYFATDSAAITSWSESPAESLRNRS